MANKQSGAHHSEPGRPRVNKYKLRPHARGWITETPAVIAAKAGLSTRSSFIHEVIKKGKPCNRKIADIIAAHSGGRTIDQLFSVGDRPPRKGLTSMPFDNWKKWARLLQREITRTAPADIEFVGTDGSFLRTLLGADNGPGLGFPTLLPIRSLTLTMITIGRLEQLAAAGLLHPARVEVARAYEALFADPAAITRADGGRIRLDIHYRPAIPAVCGTRVGERIVGGWTGFEFPGNDQLTVPNVAPLSLNSQPEMFNLVADLLRRARA